MLTLHSFEKLLPVKDDEGMLTAILKNMRSNKEFMALAQKYAPYRQVVVAHMLEKLQWKQSKLEASRARTMPGGFTLVPNLHMPADWYRVSSSRDVGPMTQNGSQSPAT